MHQHQNRWLPLVKWILAIPHYIVLVFLGVAAFICAVIAWFAIMVQRTTEATAAKCKAAATMVNRCQTSW